MQTSFSSVDAYIDSFPLAVQTHLTAIRQVITSQCPQAQEGISYGMPAYKLKGKPLMYFAAFKKHIGLYATPSSHEAFAQTLAGYKQGKGSVQLPLSEPMPLALIAEMVQFRAKNILEN